MRAYMIYSSFESCEGTNREQNLIPHNRSIGFTYYLVSSWKGLFLFCLHPQDLRAITDISKPTRHRATCPSRLGSNPLFIVLWPALGPPYGTRLVVVPLGLGLKGIAARQLQAQWCRLIGCSPTNLQLGVGGRMSAVATPLLARGWPPNHGNMARERITKPLCAARLP